MNSKVIYRVHHQKRTFAVTLISAFCCVFERSRFLKREGQSSLLAALDGRVFDSVLWYVFSFLDSLATGGAIQKGDVFIITWLHAFIYLKE
jgi:hypothetical protein